MVEVTEQKSVGNEAGLVTNDHGQLPEPCRERRDVLQDGFLGDHGANDLDELLHLGWVEEVHPDDPAWVLGGYRDLGDGQAGGVGGQDRVRFHDLVQLGEDVTLEIEMLGHGLDHEVTLGEVGEVSGVAHAVVQLALLLLGQLAPGEGAAGRVMQRRLALLGGLP